MNKNSRWILPFYFASLLSFNALAEAPVVDDSENFAVLEEQQTAHKPSVARSSAQSNYDETEHALAKENDSIDANGNNVDLINKIQGLQQDIQELRGQLEVQSHELKLLQDQQLSFYKDLDARLHGSQIQANNSLPTTKNQPTVEASIEKPATTSKKAISTPVMPELATTNITPTAVVTPTTNSTQPVQTSASSANANPADEQISYLAAYELVKNKQFDEAITAMQNFTTKYPNGGYTANAQYWLGELYLVKKNYNEAITHFDVVLQQFPSSSKYSASLLKKGYALADSGRTDDAKARLQEVMKKYPDTNASELAHLKLETLGG